MCDWNECVINVVVRVRWGDNGNAALEFLEVSSVTACIPGCGGCWSNTEEGVTTQVPNCIYYWICSISGICYGTSTELSAESK